MNDEEPVIPPPETPMPRTTAADRKRQEAEARPDLAAEVLPLWDDHEGAVRCPAEDGRPWKKACGTCAFRRVKKGEDAKDYCRPWTIPEETHFYCVHRDDKGEYRVCASFAALQRGPNPVPV